MKDMPKRNNQEMTNPKRVRLDQIVVSHQWNDEEWQSGGLIDTKGGLTAAVKARGLSFIDGAKLIQRQETGAQDTIPELVKIQQDWEAKQGQLKKKDILNLQIALINCLNKKVYAQKPKAFNILLKELCNAENHQNWLTRKTLTTRIERNGGVVTRIEQPITTFNPSQTQAWLSIVGENKPEWFTQLPSWERQYFSEKITTWLSIEEPRPNLGDYLGAVPTTIRRYPGTPNAYLSTVQVVRGDRTIEVKKIRSGMLAPFDMNKKNQEQKNEITLHNLAQLSGEAIKLIEVGPDGKYTLLLQNLYSTMFEVAGIAPLGKPDTTAVKAMQYAVETFRKQLQTPQGRLKFYQDHGIAIKDENNPPEIDLLYSLRPVNSARSGSLYFQDKFLTDENEKTTTAIVTKTYAWLKANPQHADREMVELALLNFQTPAYQLDNNRDWYSTLKQQAKDGAGLLGLVNSQNPISEMAAHEQILMSKIGMRIGSCVSGKDREELVSILLAGLVETFAQHDAFPSPANSGQNDLRDDFYQSVAHLFLSGHGMKLAGENAKGCDGIKNPRDILGAEHCKVIVDIAKNEYEIGFNPVTITDKIGGLNKPQAKEPTYIPKSLVVLGAAALTAVTGPVGVLPAAAYFGGTTAALFGAKAVLDKGLKRLNNSLSGNAQSQLIAPVNSNANPIVQPENAIVEEAPSTLIVNRAARNANDIAVDEQLVNRNEISQEGTTKRLRT